MHAGASYPDVASTNPGSGVAITASPAVNSGQTSGNTPFTLIYEGGTMVTLSAPPAAGANNFSSWNGCDTATGVTCTVTITTDRTVTANYVPPTVVTHTLTVASANPASGAAVTVSPADNSGQSSGTTKFALSYNSGVMVTLTAALTASGNNFSNWTGCDTATASTCMVTMNSDHTVSANYVTPTPGPHTLTVASTNPSSGAAITVSPADNNGQTAGTTQFILTYNNSTLAALTAAPTAGGHTFSTWMGCDSVSGATCTVTMSADRTVSANYGGVPAYAYVANQNSGDISAYKMDPTSGALTPVGTFASGIAPASVAADPAGRCLYVANSQDSIVPIAVFTISGSTGALTPGPAPLLSLSEIDPMSIAVHPTGKFAYVANFGGTVSAFAIDGNTCGLTRISGSPYAAGTLPQFATIDPSGEFLYVINFGDNNISAYKINAVSGALTPLIGSFPAGNGPTSLTVHPSGKFAYTTSSADNSVLAYTRDTATGLLAQVGTAATGGGSFSAAVDLSGKFVFVAYLNSGTDPGDVEAYAVNATTGALTQVGVFATGTSPVSVTVDPSGKFLYVANNGSTSVSAFQIDANTGALTPLAPVGFFPAGGGPISLTITTAPTH
jgi:6-phosphogluconolactonase